MKKNLKNINGETLVSPYVKQKEPDTKGLYYTIPFIRNFWKMT